jgi:hypothetical protein
VYQIPHTRWAKREEYLCQLQAGRHGDVNEFVTADAKIPIMLIEKSPTHRW